MGWQTLTVTASSGSKTVSVVSGSTANIKVGDALQVGAFSLCEIIGVYAGQLTIKYNWGNATQTGASASVIPTFGDFNTAVSAINKLKVIINDNYQALNDWTSGDGEVTFTGLDGITYTVKSASAMEAFVNGLETGLNNRIVEAIAEVTLSEPDVYIPFNDSLQIVRGYGTHDKIDLSPAQDGSVMVELPTKSVDFSCAAQRNFFNKSGRKQIADIDRPAIDNGGVLFHQAYIAGAMNSEQIVNSEIEDGGSSGWNYGDSLEVITSVNGRPKSYQVTFLEGSNGNNASSPLIRFDSLGVSTGDTVTCSAYLAGKAGTKCRLQVYCYNPTLAMAPADVIITDEFKRYQVTFIVPDTSIYTYFRFQPVRLFSENNNTGDAVKFHSPMANAGSLPLPYLETRDSTLAVPATVATVPLMNNMPEPGKSFSISAVAKVPNAKCGLFGFGQGLKEKLTIWRFDSGSAVTARISDGAITISLSSEGVNQLVEQRYTLVYDSDLAVLKFYVGGSLVDSADASMIDFSQVYSLDDTGNIGRVGNMGSNTAPLNASMKDLRIDFKALSDDEIAVLR